jgi:tetratricopeptide (TPR) repeat protein
MDGIGKALMALGDIQRAIRFHQAAQQVNPADAYARWAIGTALLLEGDYQGALNETQRALELDPHEAYIWNAVGDSQERLRNYPEALTAYRTAVELDGWNAYAQTAIARVLLQQGILAEALDACQKALDADGRDYSAFTTRGDIYYRKGNYTEAAEVYRAALLIDPEAPAARDGLGKTYVWLGDYINAAQVYADGSEASGYSGRLRLGQADVALRTLAASNDLTRGLTDNGKATREDAEHRYQECVARSPELALAAYARLAVIAAWHGDTDGALQHAEQACDSFQTAWQRRTHPDPDLLEFYALASLLRGDLEAALANLDRARAQTGAQDQLWRFDSDRVGAYILLNRSEVPGFNKYLTRLGIVGVVPSAQEAQSATSETGPRIAERSAKKAGRKLAGGVESKSAARVKP